MNACLVMSSAGQSSLSGRVISTFRLMPSRSLADDLLRPLVVSETEIARMSQLAVGGPLAEAHLGDQLWFDPVHALHGQSFRFGDRRSRLLERGETPREHGKLALAEAGPHLPAEP